MTKVISFVGPKGGCGNSIYTTALASKLAYDMKKKVVVVSFDPYNPLELIRKKETESLTETDIERLSEQGVPFRIVSSKFDYESIKALNLVFERDGYDYVILDMGYYPSDSYMPTIAECDFAFAPIVPSNFEMRSNMPLLKSIDEYSGTEDAILPVLNVFWNKVEPENMENAGVWGKKIAEIPSVNIMGQMGVYTEELVISTLEYNKIIPINNVIEEMVGIIG